MRKRYLILALLALLIIPLALAGCMTETVYQEGGVATIESPQLIILSHNMVIDKWGWATVEGTARNDGTGRMGYAEIDARFYNGSGQLIDSSFTNILNLDPGQTWAFEIHSLTEGAVSYDIGVGDSW